MKEVETICLLTLHTVLSHMHEFELPIPLNSQILPLLNISIFVEFSDNYLFLLQLKAGKKKA